MNTDLNYLYWRAAHYLIVEKGYRILNLSQDQQQIWLENSSQKNASVIRLHRSDLDWGNRMKRDVQLTAHNGEKIRKALRRNKLTVKNIYISAYPPVDDYEELTAVNFSLPDKSKTVVQSLIITMENYREEMQKVASWFNEEPADLKIKEGAEELEVYALKESVLAFAAQKANEEKSLFSKGKPFFTYFFIAVQLVVFFVMELTGGTQNTENLIRFGAKYNPLILEGEWWRFFMPIVIHIGFLHLLMNTFALYFLGTAVERIFGRGRFLFIYIFAGFTGSLASFIFTNSLSAGASGAIFGCFGALLYFGTAYPKVFFRTMGTNILVVIGINLALGFSLPGIDNAGHIGGIAGGAISAAIVHLPGKKRLLSQASITLVTLGLIPALLWYGYHNDPVFADPAVTNAEAQEKIREGDIQDASALLESAISNNNANEHTYFLYSIVKIENNQYEEAEALLKQAIELNGDFPEAHFNLAVLFNEKGEKQKALEHAEKAYLLQRDNKQFQQLYNQLNS